MTLAGRAAVVENINRAMRVHDGDSGNTAVDDILSKFIAVLHMHEELEGTIPGEHSETCPERTWSVRQDRV